MVARLICLALRHTTKTWRSRDRLKTEHRNMYNTTQLQLEILLSEIISVLCIAAIIGWII